jgi:hypothetical protein
LPVIQVQRVEPVSSVSSARALGGSRSQPCLSWKLSPRHQISRAPVAATTAVKSASVATES